MRADRSRAPVHRPVVRLDASAHQPLAEPPHRLDLAGTRHDGADGEGDATALARGERLHDHRHGGTCHVQPEFGAVHERPLGVQRRPDGGDSGERRVESLDADHRVMQPGEGPLIGVLLW